MNTVLRSSYVELQQEHETTILIISKEEMAEQLWNKSSNKFGSHDQAIEYKTKSQQKQNLDKQTTKRAR